MKTISSKARIVIVILVFFVAATAACTSRVVYDRPATNAASPEAVNINTATADELERLPHIGRKTADAIVEFRSVNGPFRRSEQVMQIRGMSESRFAEISPFIRTE
ncbi:MAG: helix-hairpin-helix domain-containing protein [Acidobacteriota bacterium]